MDAYQELSEEIPVLAWADDAVEGKEPRLVRGNFVASRSGPHVRVLDDDSPALIARMWRLQ